VPKHLDTITAIEVSITKAVRSQESLTGSHFLNYWEECCRSCN